MEKPTSMVPVEYFLKTDCSISVFIGYTSSDQLHCGILHKSLEHNSKAIHLKWHLDLVDESDFSKIKGFVFLASRIDPLRQRSIAAMCRKISKKSQKKQIPYGLRYNASIFNSKGILVLKPDSAGLTCATFVLSVFLSCGINLIEIEKWKQLSVQEDLAWQKNVLESLKYCYDKKKYGVTEEHYIKVRTEILRGDATRIKPIDVFASKQLNSYPGSQTEIVNLSKQIVDLIPILTNESI